MALVKEKEKIKKEKKEKNSQFEKQRIMSNSGAISFQNIKNQSRFDDHLYGCRSL
jgi:4-diphosphocytidyl-2C-methyl-D-erythritol kinase